ncbi:type II toxin-antitoxin system RelE/ParE family toxin [Erwiniaceae bacterium BAC15a-03b]|uniref:Toxin n=1 Tax=Winslowiella arboricola TaxID=2978220 RepID=A0A9J6PX54_9GAMM|nr:type II toxin-antitoxin system RelE/ParE family toxin [Winslowiella arboricola]MCU5771475.1 type II toxin-antitoxin system RelE/ParE family toxin [Winslowiella arboricola]MCU5778591.1 type II toxin-antitoxin system RelE/ParE family toxin [Winslowiella arboricola]
MYKLSVLAADDFAAIYDYTLLNFGEKQADRYTEEMDKCLNRLAEMPRMGREQPELGVGLLRYEYARHAIFYRLRQYDTFIIRILHQQMDPWRHLPGL